MVFFSTSQGSFDELYVGGRRRAEWAGGVDHGEWVVARHGRLLSAIRPMAYTRTLGRPRITLERFHNYDAIVATFYDGPERTFTRFELRDIYGGFLAEHAGADEFPSAEAFASAVARSRFTDYFWQTRRVRYRRPPSEARPALDIEASWTPGGAVPRYATINGRPIDAPIVHIDGVDPRKLPFLSEPFKPVPPFFPWKDLTVEWDAWPWAINDRED
jgi:hypothetical protein